MNSAAHPYRQKLDTAPYPLENSNSNSTLNTSGNNNNTTNVMLDSHKFNDGGNLSTDSSTVYDITTGMEDLYFSPTQNSNALQMSLHNNNNPGIVVSQTIGGSNTSTSAPVTPQHTQQSLPPPPPPHNASQYSPVRNGSASNLRLGSNVPYPMYESQTPPPVFTSKESVVVSPDSNPLSATSSVTNFNLNANPMDNQPFSRSENNLVAPSFAKFGHNRSVSSTSSFFYDKSSDNASMIDFNQNVIQQYLGGNSSHLMPRIKTIDLYRKNAKKSNDPAVLFQYAQYMLQTALILDSEANANNNNEFASSSQSSGSQGTDSPRNRSSENSPKRSTPSKSKPIDLNNTSTIDMDSLNDKRLKRALIKEAVHYLKKLSDKGYVEAQYLLADAYSSGALGKIENREAFVLFQAAAKHGHVESAYRTSYCYEEGLGTGRDSRKAVEYLKIAAAKNHPAAMYKLGVYSFYSKMGLPNTMNTKKMGIKWLTRASGLANELIAAAPYELGKLYYKGFEDIVIQDKKYALELYAQAAALGHIQSAAILGQHYEVGDILPQDSNLSIHYYTQAALGGDPNSMLAMCAWYLVGSEPYLPKHESEAFEWAKRAAVCNLPKAQFALANFYEKGIGCIKNFEEAQNWYKKAALNGEEKALSRISDQEQVRKIQKYMKKKPVSINPMDGTTSKAAQDKDCVIM
ncbi:Protein SKT5 [Spathaspora sp. JA1]|nr:Protein SKT5 [Spathaspora sp. JA1]